MTKLPEEFCERMKLLLSGEYDNFISEIGNGKPSKALFVNTEKITLEDFKISFGAGLTPVPYSDNAFFTDIPSLGTSPLHHAGAFYVQDPSAICTTSAVDIKKGWRVLDMCASPGSKTLEAAVKVGKTGLVVSNEYNISRCKTLVGNIERFGLANLITLNTDAAEKSETAQWYEGVFDLVICDAPCSGEGMFRKYPEQAIGDWSLDNVKLCAERQAKILRNAAKSVCDGGYLLYSTCTFSLEENEMQIDAFLSENEDFSLVPVKDEVSKVTSDGYFFEGCMTQNINLTRRFYPHKAVGEGQFIALMKKSDGSEKISCKSSITGLSKEEAKAVSDFCNANIKDFDLSRVCKYNSNIIYTEFNFPIPPRHVFSCGVKVGDVEKGRLIPHHQLFKVFGNDFIRKVCLSSKDERCAKYLHGEGIDADTENGWCAILIDKVPCGGGKAVDGFVKNHYPKGLRIN